MIITRIRNMKLATRLPLLVVIMACVVVMVIMSFVVLTVRDNIINTEDESNIKNLESYASAIGFYIGEARSVIEITAHQTETIEAAEESSKEVSTELIHKPVDDLAISILDYSDVFEYIVLLNTDGSVQVIEPRELQGNLARKDFGFMAWYKKLTSTGQSVVSDLHISTITQRPTVVVATPIRNPKGQIIGVWMGGLKLNQISHNQLWFRH
jgi:sensor histidine kinase regulating citrate/malate metabolism